MNTLKISSFLTTVLLILIGLSTVLSTKGMASEERDSLFFWFSGAYPTLSTTGDPLFLGSFSSYPTDPVADIPWACGYSGVNEIECAINNARSAENTQLGTSLPPVTLPFQATWDGMSDGEKALWLINQERIDRGIDPLDQIELNVTEVAQYYADFLLDNDKWGHYEDGLSPWERLDQKPAILDCHDNLSVAENLAVFVSTGSIPLPVERSVYMWMYDDAGSAWGHRHAILWYPYNDNSGTTGMEGFLGIGRANGGSYQGPFSNPWPFAEMIVMNVFDPCKDWDYVSTSSSSTSSPTSSTTTPTTSTTASPSSTTTTAAASSSTTTTGIFPSTTTSVGTGTSTSSPSTSTVLPGTTTTTADVIPDCPFEHIYGDSAYEVTLLRKLRDDLLSKTPEGKQLIKLYYQLSPLVVKVMTEDKNFEDEIREMTDFILPMLEKSFR
jgi:hypothetical protein